MALNVAHLQVYDERRREPQDVFRGVGAKTMNCVATDRSATPIKLPVGLVEIPMQRSTLVIVQLVTSGTRRHLALWWRHLPPLLSPTLLAPMPPFLRLRVVRRRRITPPRGR
jgi:hypothetical protein